MISFDRYLWQRLNDHTKASLAFVHVVIDRLCLGLALAAIFATSAWAEDFTAEDVKAVERLISSGNPISDETLDFEGLERSDVAPQVKPVVIFTFKPVVEVVKERLTLGLMASCAGEPGICEEAYGVDMGASPAPGRMLHITRTRLEEMLAKEWPQAKIEVRAAESVRIYATYTELTEEAVLGALRTALAQEFTTEGLFQVSVERLTLPTNSRIRPGHLRLEFPELRQASSKGAEWIHRHFAGPQRLEVHILSDENLSSGLANADLTAAGSRPQAVVVQAALVLQRKYLVPRQAMAQGQVISIDDLDEHWVKVGRMPLKAASHESELIGQRLRRPASALSPILLDQLESPLVMRRGQLVRLRMQSGSLSISGQVRTLAAGSHGQIIEAMYPATKKKLRVRVVNATTVEYLR